MTDRTLNLGTKFSADVDPLIKGITRIRKALQEYAKTSSVVGTQTATLNKGLVTAGAVSKQASAPTRRLATAHAVLGKQISRVSGGFERLKAAMKVTASYGVAATLIFSLTKAMRFAGDEIINFDQGLKNLEAITSANNAQLAAMSDVMLELARDTKFSATEISQGMVLLGQAGFTAEESLNAIKATSQLATGTLTSMQNTADLLTTTIRAFNLESIEAGRVADVFANAVNKSKLTIDKLRVAFNFVGAAASQAGLSLEQTAAAAMTLANSGLRASTIGTGLRQVLAKLIAPSEKLRESFAAHGIDLSKVNAEGFNFRKTLEHLTPLLIDHKTGMVDMAKAYELFKLRGAQAAAILIKGFATGQFDEAIKKVNEVGTAAAMSAIQQEGLAVKFKNLSDRAGALAQAIGEAGVTGAMGAFIDIIKTVISTVENFVRSGFGVLTIQTAALTAAVFGLIKSLSLLKSVIAGAWMTRFVGSMKATGVVNALTQTFGKLNLILLAVAGGIAAAIAIVSRYSGRIRRLAEEKDKLTIAANSGVQILRLYRKVLEKLHTKKDVDSVEQYRSTIKRLATEYKDLGSVVELLSLSHDELMERMRISEDKDFSESLKGGMETAIKYREEMDRLIKKHDEYRFLSPPGFDAEVNDIQRMEALNQFRQDEIRNLPKLAEAIQNSVTANERWIETLMDGMFHGKLNEEQVKEALELGKKQGIVLGTVTEEYEKLTKAVENLRQKYAEFGAFSASMIEKMPEQMKEIYDSLSLTGKIDFLKDAKSLQSRIAGIEKVLADFGITGKEVDEIVQHMRQTFLNLQRSLASPLQGANWSANLGYAGEGRGSWGPRRGSGMQGIEEAEQQIQDKIDDAKKLREESEKAQRAYQKLLDDLFEANPRTGPRKDVGRGGGPRRGSGLEGIQEVEEEIEKKRIAAAALIKREAEETAAAYEFQLSTLGRMSPEIREIYNGLSDVGKMEFIDEFLSLQNSLEDINRQMKALGFTSAQVEAVIKQMTHDFATLRSQNAWGGMALGLRDYTEQIKYSARTWRDFAESSLSGLEGSFSNFFDDVLNDADSFSDMMKNLWKDMTNAMTKSFADALAKMVMQAAIAGFGSLFGGGANTNFVPAGSGYTPSRGVGGPVSAGQAYIVGEKGKELFVPNESGRILPNGGGEASVKVVVNNNSSEQASVTESRGPDNSRQIFVTIGTDIARGGPIAGAIERTYGLQRRGRTV